MQAALASGTYVAADGFVRGLSLALTLVYTRYMIPAQFATIAIASTVTLVLLPTLGLSVSSAVMRFHFEARTEADRRRLYATLLGFLLVVPTAAVGVIE